MGKIANQTSPPPTTATAVPNSSWRKLLKWGRKAAAANSTTIVHVEASHRNRSQTTSASSLSDRRHSSSRRRSSIVSMNSMNSTVFGFGFLDMHPEDGVDDNNNTTTTTTTTTTATTHSAAATSESIDGWASMPSSPLPPSSPTGFGFADAQRSRASDAMATPGSSHHTLFERSGSQTTIYGFVDLGEPSGTTVGFEHFVGEFKYPTTHKLNPLLFNQGHDGEMCADDDDHDGNNARAGFLFGGPDDHSNYNDNSDTVNTNHTNVDGSFGADFEEISTAKMAVPGYTEGHFSVCIGGGGLDGAEESLVFWGGKEGDGFC